VAIVHTARSKGLWQEIRKRLVSSFSPYFSSRRRHPKYRHTSTTSRIKNNTDSSLKENETRSKTGFLTTGSLALLRKCKDTPPANRFPNFGVDKKAQRRRQLGKRGQARPKRGHLIVTIALSTNEQIEV